MDSINLKLLWSDKVSHVYAIDNLMFLTEENLSVSGLTLSESFLLEGIYCFAPLNLEDRQEFAKRLAKDYPKGIRGNLCFLWITIQSEIWTASRMYGWKRGNTLILERYFQSGQGNYRLTVDKGTAITCDGSKFLMEAGEGGFCHCLLGEVQANTRDFTGSIDSSGSICFDAEVETQGDIFAALDVGIRYYCKGKNEVCFPERETVITYQSPVFFGRRQLQFFCRWNPGNLYQKEATCFLIKEGTIMKGSMCDWVGNSFTVTATLSSALVLEKKPVFLYQEAGEIRAVLHDCLGPAGEYQIHSDSASKGKTRMLCGLGGTEFMELKQGQGLLSFLPGKGGFLRNGQCLGIGTTAYVAMPPGSSYVRQPKTAPFFTAGERGHLEFLSAPLLQVTNVTPSLPMMFYSDFKASDPTGMTGGELEEQLCTIRAKTLGITKSKSQMALEKTRGVTPQGLLVEMQGTTGNPSTWSMIGLANTKEEPAALPAIRFEDISDRMRGDFLQVQMKILYEDAKELMKLCNTPEEFGFTTQGWSFCLNPKLWQEGKDGRPKTIMIIKYQTISSIREWLGEHGVMSASIRRAYDTQHKPREEYAEFLKVVDDPKFQGIMFLNCPVQADKSAPGFIKEFAILLDSIDQTRLCAHHLILHHSRIIMEEGVLCLSPGEVSALVDYEQDGRISYSPDILKTAYDFSTREFSLSIREGKISRASSICELLINYFFTSPVKKATATAGNSLVIEGRLQESDGFGEFLYSLKEPGQYQLSGSGLTHIKIEEVTMNVNEMGSCFHLGGRLFFQKQGESDLFSYGYEEVIDAARRFGIHLHYGTGEPEQTYETLVWNSIPNTNRGAWRSVHGRHL